MDLLVVCFENLASNYYTPLTSLTNPFNNCGRPNLKNADPGQQQRSPSHQASELLGSD